MFCLRPKPAIPLSVVLTSCSFPRLLSPWFLFPSSRFYQYHFAVHFKGHFSRSTDTSYNYTCLLKFPRVLAKRIETRQNSAKTSRLQIASLYLPFDFKMADLQLSAPRSTPSVASFQDNDDYMGNGLMLELAPFGFEKIYDYETGGHHPVHLGDVIGSDRRYRVIHKLGSGGFANVWLCRNLNDQVPRYVALKILMAEASTDDCREFNTNKIKNFSEEVGGKYISLPLDHFKIYGPNGLHFCFVYPVAGPRFSWIIKKFEDPEKSLRKVSLHVVQAMSFLHGHGICHGG